MNEVKITLPFPPSANRIWKKNQTSVYRSAEYKQFLHEVRFRRTLDAKNFKQGFTILFDGKVSVEIVLNPPNKRKYDIDNRIKPLLDALTHACYWNDDSQVREIIVREGNITPGGNTQITIRSLKK